MTAIILTALVCGTIYLAGSLCIDAIFGEDD